MCGDDIVHLGSSPTSSDNNYVIIISTWIYIHMVTVCTGALHALHVMFSEHLLHILSAHASMQTLQKVVSQCTFISTQVSERVSMYVHT